LANLSLVVSQTTEVANSGRFAASVGSFNKPARVAVQRGDGQGKVTENTCSPILDAGRSVDIVALAGVGVIHHLVNSFARGTVRASHGATSSTTMELVRFV
jgi:hypothetical protein